MNPMPVIFVLIVVGLQDYAAAPIQGNYDATTALKIVNCANAAYNKFNKGEDINAFEDVTGEIAKETLNSRIRLLLATDEMIAEFQRLMRENVANVQAAQILYEKKTYVNPTEEEDE